MAVELDPGFWEWLRKKDQRPNSNDSINEPVSLPLYVEIPPPSKKPENGQNGTKVNDTEIDSSSVIDFVIFE